MRGNFFIVAFSILCLVAGLLFSFWPLLPLGVALLVLYGHTALGIAGALLCDLVFGLPPGLLGLLHFPFLLFAVACVGLRILAVSVVLPRSDPGAL